MAKMTLLEMVQNILSDLNSDEVDSITDTVEATQIAEVIKSSYFDLVNDTNFPETFNIGQLTALGDTTKPNYMQLPSDVATVKWIKYDNHTTADPAISYVEVQYNTPEEFLAKVQSRLSTDSTIDTIVDNSGVSLLIENDKFPEYYTSFDDDYLVFDSYNKAEQTTLTAGRTMTFCSREPTFSMTNGFIPDIDANMFPLLLSEAKSLAFVNNTQSTNAKVEQIAKRHRNSRQVRLHRIDDADRHDWPNFGRHRFGRK